MKDLNGKGPRSFWGGNQTSQRPRFVFLTVSKYPCHVSLIPFLNYSNRISQRLCGERSGADGWLCLLCVGELRHPGFKILYSQTFGWQSAWQYFGWQSIYLENNHLSPDNRLHPRIPQINGKGAPWTFHDIHPSKNQILVRQFKFFCNNSSQSQVGNILGFISVYNYLTNERVADKDLNIEDEITALKFSSQVISLHISRSLSLSQPLSLSLSHFTITFTPILVEILRGTWSRWERRKVSFGCSASPRCSQSDLSRLCIARWLQLFNQAKHLFNHLEQSRSLKDQPTKYLLLNNLF